MPRTIDYPRFGVAGLLGRAARDFPDAVASSFYGKTITYRELDTLASRFAGGLRRIGVKAGDRVSLLMPNTPMFEIAFFGILRAGAIVVQTNILYTPR